jgi:sirohydrochlorin cobaltochelatase
VARSLLVLFTHGSRDPRWLEPFERLEADLKDKLGEDRVRMAHLEIIPPTLLELAEESVRRGVFSFRLLPLFMAGGGHVAKDIPRLASEAEARFPGLKIEILPAVGEHPRVSELICEIALEAGQQGG